jgi:hypothetical protein
MKYQETGRFGRITKNMRKLGFATAMEKILFDSAEFPNLKKKEQTKYIETVMERMEKNIGLENTSKVLQECGAQCCGKSWSNFVKQIKDNSKSQEDFFVRLNNEEKKYGTCISYDSEHKSITVVRNKCICGLINKGDIFSENNTFCSCSIGHMSVFFNSIFRVDSIQLMQSIYSGDERCEWIIRLKD